MKIDLHTHTTASDGKLTPRELIDLAIKRKLKAIAIADHDNVGGIKEAQDYSRDKIEFVPGIEFSANPGKLAKEIHIVGLFIQVNKQIKELIEKQKEFKIITNRKIISKLNSLGYKITFEELQNGKDIFGRPAIAELLLKKYPEFKDRKQIFTELLGSEGKAFFINEASSIKDIIKTIHSAGGIAILAHPGYLYKNASKVIKEFIKLGGDGLEVECPYEREENPQEIRNKFRKIAEKNNLLISGGTDFHQVESFSLGDFGISNSEFKKMKEYLRN